MVTSPGVKVAVPSSALEEISGSTVLRVARSSEGEVPDNATDVIGERGTYCRPGRCVSAPLVHIPA